MKLKGISQGHKFYWKVMKTTDDYKKVKQLEEVIRNLKQADKSSEKSSLFYRPYTGDNQLLDTITLPRAYREWVIRLNMFNQLWTSVLIPLCRQQCSEKLQLE